MINIIDGIYYVERKKWTKLDGRKSIYEGIKFLKPYAIDVV